MQQLCAATQKGDLARSLGADLVINTRGEDLGKKIQDWTDGRGADVVIDNLGGEVLAKSIEAAKPLGTIVAFGFAAGPKVRFDIRSLFFSQKRLVGSMASDLKDLKWGLERVREGRIGPVLDRVLHLSQASEAHRVIAANEVAGKHRATSLGCLKTRELRRQPGTRTESHHKDFLREEEMVICEIPYRQVSELVSDL